MEQNDLSFIPDDYNQIFLELIKEGKTIKEITKKIQLPAYYIISILLQNNHYNKNILKIIKEFYNDFQINNNRCLIISDSHIGYDNNEKGIINAYDYAEQNNIKNVIHLGDLFEGKSNKNINSLEIEQQIEIFQNFYNSINNIKTFLLFGNHDNNIMNYNCYNLNTIIQNQKNIELLGIQYSYILFCKYLIIVHHPCNIKHLWNINEDYSFKIEGHHHRFSFYDSSRLIYVPTISKPHQYETEAGFLELINDENEFIFKYFNIEKKQLDEKRLIKK